MVFISVIFGLLIITSIKTVPGTKNWDSTGWLSKNVTSNLRGILALTVLLSHLRGMIAYLDPFYDPPAYLYMFSGTLAVSVFFFISGYGLVISGNKKLNLLKKRILKILLPFGVATIVYWSVLYIGGIRMPIRDVVVNCLKGNPIVSYGWYIIAQIFFYCIFYFSYAVSKNRAQSLLLICALVFLYSFIVRMLNWTSPNYHGCICFALGCTIGEFKESFFKVFKSKYSVIVIVSIPLFVILHYLNNVFLVGKRLEFLDLSGVVLCIFIIAVNTKINTISPVWRFLGKYSLEIYLYQGLVMRVIKQVFIKKEVYDDVLYAFCSVIFTIITAILINYIYTYAFKVIKNGDSFCKV